MYRSIVALLILTSFSIWSCQSDGNGSGQAETLSFSFSCENLSEEPSQPWSALFASVNESKMKIAEISVCQPIPAEEYQDYEIPAEAIGAVGGWFAGAGDYFYAIRESGTLKIYHAVLDEMDPRAGFDYQLLASYTDGRFSIDIPLGKEELTGIYTLNREDQSYVLFLGMRGEELEGQFFEVEGPLPSSDQILRQLSIWTPSSIDSLQLDTNDLSFRSDFGNGKFVRTGTAIKAIFPDKKSTSGEDLQLEKIN